MSFEDVEAAGVGHPGRDLHRGECVVIDHHRQGGCFSVGEPFGAEARV
jgi:hypothetical protein